jgi:putative glutamine amidotransferase
MSVRIAVTWTPRYEDYLESLRLAGAEPVLVEAGRDDVRDVLAACAGVLLTGGRDVDPALYGEPPDPTYRAAEPGRDAFEVDLVVRALERDVPVLAICRGAQVLNVACGGTLVQHIPAAIPRALAHQVSPPKDAIAHVARVDSASRLAAILGLTADAMGALTVPVNSRHHQAVKRPGAGLVTTATAPDGVIEAIERPASRFVVGVQWHPENFCATGEFAALFDALVAACRPSRA